MKRGSSSKTTNTQYIYLHSTYNVRMSSGGSQLTLLVILVSSGGWAHFVL